MNELDEFINCLENRLKNLKEIQNTIEKPNKIKVFSQHIISELNVIENFSDSLKKALKKT